MGVTYPSISQIDAYWEGLRDGADVIPARAALDPRGMEGALHHAFALERVAPGVARFRLAGMHLTDLMGMEVRGMPLTALFLPEARQAVSDAVERMFSVPSKAVLDLNGDRGLGRADLPARMMLLPLRDDRGQITRALGCLESHGPIGRQPRRFRITNCRHADLALANAGPAPARQGTPGFAEPPQPAFETALGGKRHLRLVVSQDQD